MTEITPIRATQDLAAICRTLAKADFVAVDTEFMREATYWPKLCLLQIAGPEAQAVVDPLAPGIDLTPFFDLMRDPKVVKVFHAARQDIEIIWNMAGAIPLPIFDTQIAAMVCGFGDAASYGALVKRLLRKNLDKSSRFTDWSRRPLSEKQLHYALGDVTHLRGIYLKLKARLEETGRASWLDEEMALLVNPKTYATTPEDAWKRLKLRARSPTDVAVLIEVAAWRERVAQSQNVPRSRVMKDDAIYDVASQAPTTIEALAMLRTVHDGFARSARGRELIEAVKRGVARPHEEVPKIEFGEPLPPAAAAIADLLRVLLKAVSARSDVAAKLIATSDDLDQIALSDDADVAALKGWRCDLFGGDALALKSGEVALAVERGQIVTVPRLAKEADGQNGQQPQRRREGTKGKAETKGFEDQSHQQTAKP
jgi:ribonuclease D